MNQTLYNSMDWLPRLLRLWAWFALITFGVMLLHQSDEHTYFNRYSTLVTLQLFGLLVVGIGAWAVSAYLRQSPNVLRWLGAQLVSWRAKQGFSLFVLVGAALLLAGGWLFF